MIVCTQCLHRNDDDAEFCVSCGTYLDWTRERGSGRAPASRARPARRPSAPDGRAARRARPATRAAVRQPPAGQPPASDTESDSGASAPPVEAPGDGPALDVDDRDPEVVALARAARRVRERAAAARGAATAPTAAAVASTEAPPRRRSRPTAPPRRGRPEPPPLTDGQEDGEAAEAPLPSVELEPRGPAEGPGPEQPRPLDPTEARTRVPPRTVTEDDFAARAGDLVCPRCGAGNAPSRYFCRRCGNTLQRAVAEPDVIASPVAQPVRRRWWWRFRRRLDEVPDTPAAPPDWKARAKAALPVFVVLALLAGALGPWRSGIAARLEAARKRIAPKYVNVYPAKVEASTFLPDHPPQAAADGAPNTYWAEAGPTSGEDEGLIFSFDRPFDLARVGFYNGAQTKPQDFLSQPRLRVIHLVFDTGETQNLTLADKGPFQSYEVKAKRVKVVTMLITSVYPSPLGGTDASLGEVEFFTTT